MEISNGVYFLIFLLGLAVGSFLNSVIYRLERGESFFLKRSYCPFCRQKLGWQDLIPILSFLILEGKCRHCQQKISWQYPLVELSTATLFLLPFIIHTDITLYSSINLIFYWVVSSFLIIIFVYDLKHYIIPDKIIYPAIIFAFIYQLLLSLSTNSSICGDLLTERCWGNFGAGTLNPLLSAILAGLFFLVILLASRGKWLGFGDVKLVFFLGLFLGFPKILVALFLAFFLGAIIGIGLIISGKKTFKSEVPFGPFLVAGTFSAFFWGQQIINWYLHFIFL